MTIDAGSANLIVMVIINVGVGFGIVSAIRTDINWIKKAVDGHTKEIEKLKEGKSC